MNASSNDVPGEETPRREVPPPQPPQTPPPPPTEPSARPGEPGGPGTPRAGGSGAYGTPPPPPHDAPPPGAPPHVQQPPLGEQPGGAPQRPGPDSSNTRLWATATHWGALLGWFVTSGVLGFLVPLLIMTTQGRDSTVVRRNAVESLNFQLSLLIYEVTAAVVLVIGILLSFVLVGIPIAIVAGLALLALVVSGIVFPIIASVKSSNDEEYSYPWTLRLAG